MTPPRRALANYMMPDGSHSRKSDVIYFIFNRSHPKMSSVNLVKKPVEMLDIDGYHSQLDAIKDKQFPISVYVNFAQTGGTLPGSSSLYRVASMGDRTRRLPGEAARPESVDQKGQARPRLVSLCP